MIQLEHLQVYDLTLTVKTPIFVGSGTCYCKHEYMYDSWNQKVYIVNQDALFTLLLERDLIDRYENFILRKDKKNLHSFLKTECGCSEDDIHSLVQYSLSAKDALKAKESLKEIHAFQRNADGRAYISGSSVKGALRTVYLLHCILADKGRHGEFSEPKYLHTLSCKGQKKEDALNSIFRGIQISDSIPIGDDSMILAGKYDISTKGNENKVNVCRECVKPGHRIHMKLTLDQSILKGKIKKEILLQSIREFSEYYQKTYVPHFEAPSTQTMQNCLILGGGAGFFSKTLTYPYYGEQEGLKRVAENMCHFRNHHHEQDKILGISPHMMKYTKFGGKLYPFGLCEVDIE